MSNDDRDDNSVEPTSADERQQAEALAHALERGTAGPRLPEDALAAAALLRHSRDGAELPSERERSILAELLKKHPMPSPARTRGRRWLYFLLPLGAAAAAALLLVPVLDVEVTGSGADSSALPNPTSALLSAQAAAILSGEDGERGASALRKEMRSYRGVLHAALHNRYSGTATKP